MRHLIILLSLVFGAAIPAIAQVSVGIGIGLPNANIGINFPSYPRFEQVPGYPVYYAPQVNSNYFFYDGMYWVYVNDSWYASSWYNGPWALVEPMVVPVYILRVPVRYYREPPVYFRGWQQDAPPRWDDHWGNDWRRRRGGWDRWNRNSMPPPAPLPTYQQQYSGGRYPSFEQQRMITSQNYHYRPHEPVVQQHYERFMAPTAQGAAQNPPQNERARQTSPQNRNDEQDVNNPHRPSPAAPDRPPPHQPRPIQDHGPAGPGDGAWKQPQQQHESQQQLPNGQHDASPGHADSTTGERQSRQPQQPAGQSHGSLGQGENAPKERQDQGRDQGGDGVRDKETPHGTR
jgi:hypothetical protein